MRLSLPFAPPYPPALSALGNGRELLSLAPGAGTEILDETDATGSTTNSSFNEYVFFGGRRIARHDSSNNVYYYFADPLGSSRSIVQAGQSSACYDADFYPFGGEKQYTNTCPQNYKFEGKERDTETGNDDFGARYYSSVYGRWLSPDWSSVPAPVPYANLTNPQTLNLYAMVSDNPESFADLDGHFWGPGGWFAQILGEQPGAPPPPPPQTPPPPPPDPPVGPTPKSAAAGAAVADSLITAAASNPVGGALAALAAPSVVGVAMGLAYPSEATGSAVDAMNPPYLAAPPIPVSGISQSQGSGPKAADAPGVTAGGQATDKYGNKLGPSNEPQVNKTKSNTREGARNKALNEGSGAVEHSTPVRGGPHFHPTDNEGNKKPESTHHEYPD